MKKTLLSILIAAAPLFLFAQLPSYLPTEGLVGWWPFNGNANDESGNGNDGSPDGTTLTDDRFGLNGSAYNFDGINDKILIQNVLLSNSYSDHTTSIWIKTSVQTPDLVILTDRNGDSYWYKNDNRLINGQFAHTSHNNNCINQSISSQTVWNNQWHHLVAVFDSQLSTLKLYLDGILVEQNPSIAADCYGNVPQSTTIGCSTDFDYTDVGFFNGEIDDIGIWNRALNQQEITELYNAVNCANNTTITPQTNSLTIGSTATFAASTSDPNPSYVWQSEFGQGFQTLNNFGNYSGTNTGTLNIANVQLPNHTQPIRVITTSGNCIDTSNVAIISITDTCINTITDTTLITVTDTLLINTTITGLNPPNISNTIKLFPNPTNDHITIDYGNFFVMNGYQLTIENSLGQQVFQTNITQQSDYLNLTTWGGNGLYFVHIIDPQGNTIDIRKILLQ
jgi:hypothetical protein